MSVTGALYYFFSLSRKGAYDMWPLFKAHEVFSKTKVLFEIMIDSREVLKIVQSVPTFLPRASSGHSQDVASLCVRASATAALCGQTCGGVPLQDGLPRVLGPSATVPNA